MDPLTIISATVALSKSIIPAVITISAFINATSQVDDSVASFYTEIKCLSSATDALLSTLHAPRVHDVLKSNTSRHLERPIYEELITCKITVDELTGSLESVKRKGGVFRQAIRQIKLNLKDTAIKEIRSRVHTHQMNLNMVLQMIHLHVSCQSPVAIVDEMISKMNSLTKTVRQVTLNQGVTQYQEDAGVSEGQSFRSTEHLKGAAKELLYQSSLVAKSVGSETSVVGVESSFDSEEMIRDFNRSRIETWIPTPAPLIQKPREIVVLEINPLGHGISVFSLPLRLYSYIPTTTDIDCQNDDATMENFDSGDDHNTEMIRSFLAKGHQKFSQGEFSQATTSFQRAIERANGMKQTNFISSELVHARVKIGLISIHEGKLEESEKLFSAITNDSPQAEGCVHEADAAYILARLMLHNNNLDAAERYCKQASSSRKRIFDGKHPFYLMTIRLFAEIYKARGLLEDSSICLDLIPDPSILPEDLPEIHSYRTEAFDLLNTRGFDLNSPQFDPDSALLWAAAEGHEPVVRYLLTNGASIKAMSAGVTALHLAASRGQEAVVRLLLAGKANVKAVGVGRLTALHVAARHAKEGLVRLILNASVDAEATDELGRTALHYSAGYGNFATAKLLLEFGADVEAVDCSRSTALHKAAYHGHEAVIRLLSEHQADVNVVDFNQNTPLHMAALNGHENAVQLLLHKGAGVNFGLNITETTPLHSAASNEHENVIRLLLNKGANIDAVDYMKETPLYLAASAGYGNVIQLLLNNGAFVNARNKFSSTPLHEAASNGHENVVRLLLNKGANIDAVDCMERTPLYLAASAGYDNVIQLLLDNGADVNSRNSNKATPLHCAAAKGHDNVIQLLLNNGAFVNARNKFSSTPLHEAASNGHENVVRLLLNKEANINAVDFNESTPLYLATQNGHRNLIRLLSSASNSSSTRPTSSGPTAVLPKTHLPPPTTDVPRRRHSNSKP